MRILIILAALAPLCAARATADDDPLRRGWVWRPSVFVFGSIDEIGDGAPEPMHELLEASPAMSLAASLDASREGRRGRLQTSTLGLIRSPFARGARNYFFAGRLHAVSELGADWRLTLDDSVRFQRRDAPSITDFQRNEIVAGLEWRPPHGMSFGLRLSDRRRALPHLAELGFERQGAVLAAGLGLGRRFGAELSLQWQRYSAITTAGRRVVLSAELARYGSRGAIALRGAWFEPGQDGNSATPTSGPPVLGPSLPPDPRVTARHEGSGTAVDLLPGSWEALALQGSATRDAADLASGTDIDLAGDPFLFDPLESDSDEWDFGRRKQVIVAFFSRRFGDAWRCAAIVRYQHKNGPNLLLTNGGARPWFKDDRVALRASLQRHIHRHINLYAQGCHLISWADRPELDFSRTLVAVGVQLRY
ncbi:MAG: hypothetical protein JXO72_10855 [Vicinamibacteria bacterium]|nr:hypothetical protein [Vicinamibacteria bacterium]